MIPSRYWFLWESKGPISTFEMNNIVELGQFSYIRPFTRSLDDYKKNYNLLINSIKNNHHFQLDAELDAEFESVDLEVALRSRNRARNSRLQAAPQPLPAPSKPKKSTVHFTTSCSICLEDFGNEKISSTNCGHLFHSGCLETALEAKKECPNCRAAV